MKAIVSTMVLAFLVALATSAGAGASARQPATRPQGPKVVGPYSDPIPRRWREEPCVVIGAMGAADLRPDTDELLGRMLLDVARTSLKRLPSPVLASGKIDVDRAESRIVVRVVRRPDLEADAARLVGHGSEQAGPAGR